MNANHIHSTCHKSHVHIRKQLTLSHVRNHLFCLRLKTIRKQFSRLPAKTPTFTHYFPKSSIAIAHQRPATCPEFQTSATGPQPPRAQGPAQWPTFDNRQDTSHSSYIAVIIQSQNKKEESSALTSHHHCTSAPHHGLLPWCSLYGSRSRQGP